MPIEILPPVTGNPVLDAIKTKIEDETDGILVEILWVEWMYRSGQFVNALGCVATLACNLEVTISQALKAEAAL
jgi:hypothetical protein